MNKLLIPAFLYFINIGLLHSQTFTKQLILSSRNETGTKSGNAQWGDFDNDNDLDILLNINDSVYWNKTFIYENKGDAGFASTEVRLRSAQFGKSLWHDYDNDNDLDIIVSGYDWGADFANQIKTIIYSNDGADSFIKDSLQDLLDVAHCSVLFFDSDNDGDNDLFLSGGVSDEKTEAILYENKNGVFTETETAITAFRFSNTQAGDYDNDLDLDILVTGDDISGNRSCRIIENLGNNQFKALEPFIYGGITNSEVKWEDIDSDGDLDIFTCGMNYVAYDTIARIYENDGAGNYTAYDFHKPNDPSLKYLPEHTGINPDFMRLDMTYTDFGDYDNDGDLDLAISGVNARFGYISKVYQNNGNFNFTEAESFELQQLHGTLEWGDFDNDGDLDLLQDGHSKTEGHFTNIYINNSTSPNLPPATPKNTYSQPMYRSVLLSWSDAIDQDEKTPSKALSYNIILSQQKDGFEISCPLADLENGNLKMVSRGQINNTSWLITDLDTGMYYWRVQAVDLAYGASAFTELDSFTILNTFSVDESILTDSMIFSLSVADFDYDGDYDFITTEENKNGSVINSEYFDIKDIPESDITVNKNNGDNSFTTNPKTYSGYISVTGFADTDNDNKLNYFIYSSADSSMQLQGTGDNGCIIKTGLSFCIGTIPNRDGSPEINSSWGDYNGDGLVDIIISGIDKDGVHQTKLYKNEGGNQFSEVTENPFADLHYGSMEWADYDNDGDLDLFITGKDKNWGRESQLWNNNGKSGFDLAPSSDIFRKISAGAGKWIDFDNDGDLDLFLCGNDQITGNISKLYENTGSTFIEVDQEIAGMNHADVKVLDYDNDGLSDLMLSGGNANLSTLILKNSGNGEFEQIDYDFTGMNDPKLAIADFDNDTDLDILTYGDRYNSEYVTKTYWNNVDQKIEKPSAPQELSTVPNGLGMVASWSPPVDNKNEDVKYSYNIRVGTESNNCDIVSPMSDLKTGHLFVQQMGNCQLNTSWKIDSLPSGTYYWSVQAVSNSFVGGEWSETKKFTIERLRANFTADTVCLGTPTSFTDQTATSVPIDSWQWDFGDGYTETAQNAEHTFTKAGIYEVTLKVQADTSTSTFSKKVFVKQGASVSFEYENRCLGQTCKFINTSSFESNDTISAVWEWKFGDQSPAEKYETEHSHTEHGYNASGTYMVTLSAELNNGCKYDDSADIKITEKPLVVISKERGEWSFCEGADTLEFSVPKNEQAEFIWYKNGKPEQNTTNSILISDKSQAGEYWVRAQIPDTYCSDSSDTKKTEIKPLPTTPIINQTGTYTVCDGETINLTASATDTENTVWMNQNKKHAEYSSSLTLSSGGDFYLKTEADGCQASSDTVSIIWSASPSIDKKLQGNTISCKDDITLSINTDENYSYSWYKNSIKISGETGKTFTTNQNGLYYAQAENNSGCKATTEEELVVIYEQPSKPEIRAKGYEENGCEGQNISLSVANIELYDYQWYFNGNPLESETIFAISGKLAEGSYFVKSINEICESTSEPFSIAYKAGPDKPKIECLNPGSWYLSSLNREADDYKWYYNGELLPDANTFYYFADTKEGTYQLAIKEDGECYAYSDELKITENTFTYVGIEDGLGYDVSVYPNPCEGEFAVSMDNPYRGNISIQVTGLTGNIIYSATVEKTSEKFHQPIQLNKSIKGLLFLKLHGGNNISIKPIIVK